MEDQPLFDKYDLLAQLLEEAAIDVLQTQLIAPRQNPGSAPLSFSQQRLWFLDQLMGGSALYNIPSATRLFGQLDLAALEQAVNLIVQRHETLRASFMTVEGRPVQSIALALTIALPVIDLQAAPAAEREAMLEQIMAEEAQRPFDLQRGPLLRISIVRLAADEHVLLVTMHHISSDGWSSGVFESELQQGYNALVTGRRPELPALPIQYADYAAWQREWLQGAVLEQQLAYWKDQLAGHPPVLALPTDRPRPPIQTFRGTYQPVAIPAQLTQALRSLSQQEGVTLFMTLLAAFQTLLGRYADQDDIIVGSPIANRTQAETEGLIGFFINTLVLRTDLSANPSFRELLHQVREVCLGAYDHQDLPFEQLMEVLQPTRDMSHTPLFQVMFALQATGGTEPAFTGLRRQPLRADSATAKFDLTLSLAERNEDLVGMLEYNSDLFDAATITRMLGHFQVLLAGMIANPDQRIADLPLLTTEEETQLRQWSSLVSQYPTATLQTTFEAQAVRTPHAPALSYADQHLTYAELNERTNQLAHHLRALGIGPGSLVALCLERSLDMVVAILGTLKAGGAYVPLDPAYPSERLQFILQDSQAALVLTQLSLIGQLPASPAQVIALDAEQAAIAAQPTANPASTTEVESTAYVIYTSGSTGKPKGVLVSHGNVARLFTATEAWFHFSQADVWTMFHSYAFDFSVWELWGALLYGGRLVVVPYLVSRSPEAFYELLGAEGVTILNQTPSAFGPLMRVDAQAGLDAPPLSLRAVIFGGEALDLKSLQPWIDRRGDQHPQLINMYGITETTVHVTYQPITAALVQGSQGSLIGQAIPDLDILVLDRSQNLAPIGIPGEMYVGGAGVAQGYLNRPELNRERFIPNPFAGGATRLYRTGDLARYLPDGTLEYLGRIDQQVKVRGFRIELGEIEAVLKSHPAVNEAVVLARAEGAGEKRLVAYVVAAPEQKSNVSELRRFIKEYLPEYMLPAAFVVLDALPLTRNGKVDHRALPLPGQSRPELEEAYVAPQTPAEELLAGIWAAVLGIEQVGVQDNFFALGGDSIRSVRVLALARQKGLQFSLQQLFQHQTIQELAREINLSGETAASVPRSQPFSLVSAADRARLPADSEDAYPLTMLQSGMLYHMQLHPEAAVYHNVDSFHLRGRFDLTVFRAAVQRTVALHPILRTSFDLLSYSEPLQIVHPRAVLPLAEEDIRHLAPAEQQAVLDGFRERERLRHFDLATPPLLRFFIHRRSAETFQFTLTECHAILDGWSLTSILSEIFNQHYAMLDNVTLPAEPPLTLTFRDFVQLELLALESEACRSYWLRQLVDHTVMKLPRWPVAPADPAASPIRSLYPEIPLAVSAGLSRLALSAAVPIKSVLLAAHLKVMSMLSGQTDIMTGLVCNGRPEEIDGERIRGLFLNTVPFRQQLGSASWLDLVHATFEAERELLPYRRYPLAAIQQDAGSQMLFETLFNFVRFHSLEGLVKSGNFDMLEFEGSEETNFTLFAGFGVNLASSRVTLHLDLDASALSEAQIERICAYYLQVLETMAANPQARHDLGDLLPAAERHQLLAEWNSTAADYPRTQQLHQLVEAQVASTPDQVALIYGDHQLTYGDLNARANQLARHLRQLGVGPETLVGVCVDRTLNMVIGLLAILKAGGAYVPLDPAYPPERLAFMLADTQTPVLITQQSLIASLPIHSAQVVALDTDWALIEQHAASNLVSNGAKLAYVLYTSGSTGWPKGVAISHQAAVNFIHWAGQTFAAADLAGVLAATSINFDLSVFELFTPLTQGGTVILAENVLQVPTLAHAADITLINTVPAAMAELIRAGGVPAAVRTINLAGEPLSQALVDEIYAQSNVRQVFNLYGPTEATTYATSTPVARAAATPPTIGRPVANTQIYLLNAQLQPIPAGVPGEVYIGGDSLARGYLRRPDLTAERFIPNPFRQSDPEDCRGSRLYRTGDLACYRPDGTLEYLGRIDGQVKVRGFRIELGEIEAVLRRHPALREVVVVAREDAPGEKRLVAYVVAGLGETPTGGDLREWVKQQLPNYMVPAVFMPLPALPLTPNGKVNRQALPAPEGRRPELEAAYVAPSTEIEQAIAGFWQAALHLEQVGIYDNFFDLGGNSLSLIRIHSKLCNLIGKAIPMTTMFKYSSINALAKHLSEQPGAQPASFSQAQDRARQQKAALQRQQQLGKGRKKTHE